MTDEQRREILVMREKGSGYKKIAAVLDIPESTVKSFCIRRKQPTSDRNLSENIHHCNYCGREVKQVSGRKLKKFCSDECRMKWWNANPDKVKRKAIYTFTCISCKKEFRVYGNANRKYCSHKCYIENRFGGVR